MSWQRTISHSGLNAFRVIRGVERADVDKKAEMQLKAWDEKWRKIQEARKKEADKRAVWLDRSQKANIAKEKTREAQERISAIDNTLLASLRPDPGFDWDFLTGVGLSSHPYFTALPPAVSGVPELPREPQRVDILFQPKLTMLDRIFPTWREKKVADAERRFDIAHDAWVDEMRSLLAESAKKHQQWQEEFDRWKSLRVAYEREKENKKLEVTKMKEAYLSKLPSAIVDYCYIVLEQNDDPDNFPRSCLLEYSPDNKLLLVEYALPLQSSLPNVKEIKYVAARDIFTEVHVTDAWLRRTYDSLLYKIALRVIFELFKRDTIDALGTIVLNGFVTDIDKATGKEFTACILSIQVLKEEFMQINLAQVEPKACFKKLKGVSASTFAELTPVRPILQLKRDDKRFVQPYGVTESLDGAANLAAMDWEDFENLIRELFEKEFTKSGAEVKITRASRDGGVDAIVFDPDPIRGGKIVIQAKRYTNTVSVSAVRDLYGTVLNEGANKGILVTTADYGPDAYAFAKDKPLTLLNGSELLYLLENHGRRARIDINEARKILGERRP